MRYCEVRDRPAVGDIFRLCYVAIDMQAKLATTVWYCRKSTVEYCAVQCDPKN